MSPHDVFRGRPRRVHPLLLHVVAALLTVMSGLVLADTEGPATGPATRPVNERCPVMADEAASPLHEVIFRGTPVRFCCRQCKDRFLLEPQAYLARLPHVPPESVANAATTGAARERGGRDLGSVLRRLEVFVNAWRPIMIGIVVAGLVHLFAARAVRRRLKREPEPTAAPKRSIRKRLIDVLARPSTLLVALLALALFGQWSRRNAPPLTSEPRPPVPFADGTAARFAADMARQGILQGPEFVALLEKTYYRGNDERSPNLFNGGVYRTCTFHVSLRTEDGETITAGQNVEGQRLFVRVEIRRARGSLQSHFTDAEMSRGYLLSRSPATDDPLQDANADDAGGIKAVHSFVILKPGVRWAAGCPIVRVASEQGVQRLDGMVLLCPSGSDAGSEAWKAAHYGIQYALRFEKGVVTPSSKLWMGALLFTEDFPDHRLHEWLSWRPLPEIPEGFRHVSETD